MQADPRTTAALVLRLRAAGCVFAEDEAAVLVQAAADAAALEAMVRRRVAGEPLEPLVGHVRLGSLDLVVAPGVFVPRRRTLLLVGLALAAARRHPRPVVLELCAGVAPVAAHVAAALPQARLHAVDVDPAALAPARANLPPGAQVMTGHLYRPLPGTLRGRVDVVAAVPPYVPDDDLDRLPREARDHEPHRALLGGPDGLAVLREVVDGVGPWLSPRGRLLLELNHRQYAAAAAHGAAAGLQAVRHDGDDGQTVVLDLHRDPA